MLVWKSLYLGSLRDNWNIASDFHIKFIGLFLKNIVIEMSIGAKFLKTSFLAGVLFFFSDSFFVHFTFIYKRIRWLKGSLFVDTFIEAIRDRFS